ASFGPICKGAPARIVAPFRQQDGVRIEAVEIAAQAGGTRSTSASDVQDDEAPHGVAFPALAAMVWTETATGSCCRSVSDDNRVDKPSRRWSLSTSSIQNWRKSHDRPVFLADWKRQEDRHPA